MIGAYEAQPEGQRLTTHHRQFVRRDLKYYSDPYTMIQSREIKKRSPALVKKMNELRKYLRTGEKTTRQIAKKLKIKNVQGYVENFKISVALYCPDIWEEDGVWGLAE